MGVVTVDVQREARVAGLRRHASLEAVEQRRTQLWAVMAFLLVGASAIAVLASVTPERPAVALSGPTLGFALVGLALGFSAYVFEKERALRRLTRMLVDERVLRESLMRQLRTLEELVAAERALSASLELERVVELALDGAVALFGAPGGAILLAGRDGRLHPTKAGAPEPSTIAGEVAATRQAVLGDDAMSVPLVSGGALVGVLELRCTDGAFRPLDLSVLETFAQHASVCIANACRFEEERAASVRYRELEAVREEFRWLAREELAPS